MELFRIVINVGDDATLRHGSRYQFLIRNIVSAFDHSSLSRVLVIIDVSRSLTRTSQVSWTNANTKRRMRRSYLV